MEDLDLHAKLVLDDAASQETERIGKGFKRAGEEADSAEKHVGFLEHTMANFAAIELHELTSQVREFGASLVEAAAHGENADKAVAGLIASVQGREWGDAHKEAEGLGDDLDAIALKSHQANDDIANAFQKILEISGATEQGVEKATDQVAQMGTIANVLNKSTEDIAGQFAMMGEGILKTKSQMFQILQPTGIFGENIKKAAAGWASLTEEERAKRLEYALGRVSAGMAQAKPTFNDLMQTMANIADIAKEKIGEPIIHALNPQLEKLTAQIEENLPAIEEFGRAMEVDVKQWVGDAASAIQEGFTYLKSHAGEIHDELVSAVETVRDVVNFILEHKEALAIAFGAKAALSLGGGLAKTVAENPLAKGALSAGKALYSAGASGAGMTVGGAAGGLFALGAGAAALAAIGLASDQLIGLYGDVEKDTRSDFDSIREGMKRMSENSTEWTDVETKAFERMRYNLLEAAKNLGEDVGAAAAYATALESQTKSHVHNMKMLEGLERQAKELEWATQHNAQVTNNKTGEVTEAADSQEATDAAARIQAGFEAASAVHDQASIDYIAHLFQGSKTLASAFLTTANLTDEGWKTLGDAIAAGGDGFKDLADMFKDQVGGAQSNKKLKMENKFSFGAGSVKITQDFKDANPDRVALIFTKDLARKTSNRAFSNTGIG